MESPWLSDILIPFVDNGACVNMKLLKGVEYCLYVERIFHWRDSTLTELEINEFLKMIYFIVANFSLKISLKSEIRDLLSLAIT